MNDLGKIIVFLLLFLALFLFTANSKNKLSNRLFAFFLLITSIDFSGLFLPDTFRKYHYLHYIKISSVLLQMPLFYLYVKSLCYYNFKLKTIHIYHLLLFLVFLLLFIITGLSDGNIYLFDITSQLQYYAYIITILYELRRYKKVNLENYSFQNKIYQWLFQTTVLFLIGNSFSLFRKIYGSYYEDEILYYFNFGVILFALFIISWFVLKTMRNPELFSGIDYNLKSIKKSLVKDTKQHSEEIDFLSEYMITNKPYLEDKLTLQDLSQHMNMPEKHLSFLINRIIGKHFFDYINDFRIKEAKHLLKEKKDLTVLEIMYMVGFNSKSSFYTAFRKSTNKTPLEYRKSTTS